MTMNKTGLLHSSSYTVLVICKSGRLDALAYALWKSPRLKELHVFSEVSNYGLSTRSNSITEGNTCDVQKVLEVARKVKPDFVVFGPEEPLEAGVVNALAEIGIPSVGPTKELAYIETSKSFTRELIRKYGIAGNPQYRIFSDAHGLQPYLESLKEFVIKPDGLTGGKGVKVFGDHFKTIEEGLAYCN